MLSTGEERSAGSRGDGLVDRSGFDGEAREREGSALASFTRMPRLAACSGPCGAKPGPGGEGERFDGAGRRERAERAGSALSK